MESDSESKKEINFPPQLPVLSESNYSDYLKCYVMDCHNSAQFASKAWHQKMLSLDDSSELLVINRNEIEQEIIIMNRYKNPKYSSWSTADHCSRVTHFIDIAG